MTEQPWGEPGWLGRRVRELVWQGLSWPYLVAIAFTVASLRGRDPTMITAALGAWGVALGRRLVQQGLEARAGGLAAGPGSYVHTPAEDDQWGA